MNHNEPSQPPARRDRYDVAADFLMAPYGIVSNALHIAGTAIRRGNSSVATLPVQGASQAAVEQVAQSTELVEVTRPPEFLSADLVDSFVANGMTVCLYQYFKDEVILVKARKDGVTKQVTFTPAIAASLSLPYNFKSAAIWVRKSGFVGADIADVPKATAKKSTKKLPPAQEPVAVPPPVAPTVSVPTGPKLQQSSSNPKRPFEGRIESFGMVTKPGLPGGNPYEIYEMVLVNDSIGQRAFTGEKLSELVDEHSLKLGQFVRLHPLGKQHFEVLIEGVPQKRWRNEYTIEV